MPHPDDRKVVLGGRVVDAAGLPVVGARVLFTSAPVPVADIAALTDGSGRFALEIAAIGSVGLAVHATGYEPALLTVDLEPTAVGQDLEVVLHPA